MKQIEFLSYFFRSFCHLATVSCALCCLHFYEIMSSNIFISSFAQLVPMLRINKCLLRDITWFILYLPFLCRFLLTFFVHVLVCVCSIAIFIRQMRMALNRLDMPAALILINRMCHWFFTQLFCIRHNGKIYMWWGVALVQMTINLCVFILTNEEKKTKDW